MLEQRIQELKEEGLSLMQIADKVFAEGIDLPTKEVENLVVELRKKYEGPGK